MPKVSSLSVNMSLSTGKMSQICLLLAAFMLASVLCRDLANTDATEREPSVDENKNIVRRQSTTLCGRRPGMTSTGNMIRRQQLYLGQPYQGGFLVRNEESDGEDNDLDKILGGSNTVQGEIPWQVNVYRNGLRACGGVIINSYWVLTAAECVMPSYTSSLNLTVGEYDMTSPSSGRQVFSEDRIVLHGSFIESNNDNNLALIKVSKKDGHGIEYNNNIQPVCLPVSGENPAVGTQLTVSGWGRTSGLINSGSQILKKAVLPVFNLNTCKSKYSSGRVTDRMLCAGENNANSDLCSGDNGGPATYKSGGVYILAGIISSGSGCTAGGKPVILSSVLANRDWIISTIDLYSSAAEKVLPSRT